LNKVNRYTTHELSPNQPTRELPLLVSESKVQFSTISNQKENVTQYQHSLLLDVLKRIPQKLDEMNKKVTFDKETLTAANLLGGMFVSQLEIEKKQLSEARQSYQDFSNSILQMGRGTGLKNVQNIMLEWFESVCDEIVKEVKSIQSKVHGKDRVVRFLYFYFVFYLSQIFYVGIRTWIITFTS
jgi:hypothetical protein